MRDFETRSERNFDSIYQFLNSEQNELELILYSREVVSLQRRIPRIVIIKGKPYSRNPPLYRCIVRRQTSH